MSVPVIAVLIATVVAGALGALVRAAVVARAARAGTHAVNLVGTVLLAGVTVTATRGCIEPWAVLVVGIGFAGALTTFSGWIAVIAARTSAVGRTRAVLVDAVLPTLVAVGLTVAVFVGA